MPKVKIRIPTPLRSFVGGRDAVEVEAETAEEALGRLTEESPALRGHLYAEDGRLRQFVNVYVGERNLRETSGDSTALDGVDEIRIVPSIAGGGPTPEGAVQVDTGETEETGETAVETGEETGGETDGRPGPGARADVDLTPAELRRYSRHLMIPEVGLEGQKRLKAGRVMLVGAGGLGSPLGLYLAAAGVGTIGIVDFDVVDESNLQRQVLHDTSAVGSPKLESARRRIEGLNPEVEVVTHEARLDSSNALEALDGWDLVVDGSDNFPTRYLVNDATVMLGIPTVYGAIYRFDGQASVFGTPDGPCYRCLFREPPPPGLVPSCADAGVLGVLPGIVGTIQATEAVKLLLGVGETLAGRLLLIDALRMEFRELKVRRDPECPVCGEEPTVTELIDYEAFCGVAAAAEEDEEGETVPEIDVTELKRRADEGEAYVLVDVREPYEWEICNLEEEGARLIPLGDLPGRTDEIPRDAEVVVHCRSGGRSAEAVRYLRERGWENAVNLQGGILAWAREVDRDMPEY